MRAQSTSNKKEKMNKFVQYVPIDRFEESAAKKLGTFLVVLSVISSVVSFLFYDHLGARRFSVLFLVNLMFAALGGSFFCYRRSLSFHVRLWSENPRRRALIVYSALLVPIVVVVVMCVILGCASCAGIFLLCVAGALACVGWCCFVYRTCIPKDAREDIAAGALLPVPEVDVEMDVEGAEDAPREGETDAFSIGGNDSNDESEYIRTSQREEEDDVERR